MTFDPSVTVKVTQKLVTTCGKYCNYCFMINHEFIYLEEINNHLITLELSFKYYLRHVLKFGAKILVDEK